MGIKFQKYYNVEYSLQFVLLKNTVNSFAGVASAIGGYCAVDSLPSSLPRAIIRDNLDFSGILRATHEIGHM